MTKADWEGKGGSIPLHWDGVADASAPRAETADFFKSRLGCPLIPATFFLFCPEVNDEISPRLQPHPDRLP